MSADTSDIVSHPWVEAVAWVEDEGKPPVVRDCDGVYVKIDGCWAHRSLVGKNTVMVVGRNKVVLGVVAKDSFLYPERLAGVGVVHLPDITDGNTLTNLVVHEKALAHGHKIHHWPPNTPILDSIWLTHHDPRLDPPPPPYVDAMRAVCDAVLYGTLSTDEEDEDPQLPRVDSEALSCDGVGTTVSPEPSRSFAVPVDL